MRPQQDNKRRTIGRGEQPVTIRTTLLLAVFAFAAACGERDIILEGERLSIRDEGAFINEARDISLPVQQANVSWTHRYGSAQHAITHPSLPAVLTQAFAVNIGQGDTRRARITADPVVANNVIYTLDAHSLVTATSTAGAILWAVDLAPRLDGAKEASGGGLAVQNGVVYATTGFGALTALDASNGAQLWVQDLDAPGTAAPTVVGDLVYVVGRDSTAWAVETDTGRVRWQTNGTPSIANFSGGAGVAANSEIAVIPFPSGEVIGAFPLGGLRRWSTVVSGDRLGEAVASITDIAADPVLVGDRAYVGNFSGRLVALNSFDGERIWTAEEGAVSPVWPAGDSIFLVNDLNQLVRLDAADGSPIWKVQLPQFTETRVRQQRTVFAHFGPILAGGRLIIASSDGVIRSFDPVSGAELSQVALPGGAASHPVVAGNTLYVVDKTGQLVAFR